jgi:hypothetical protein
MTERVPKTAEEREQMVVRMVATEILARPDWRGSFSDAYREAEQTIPPVPAVAEGPIVRKVRENGVVDAFWLNAAGEVRGWWEYLEDKTGKTAEQERAQCGEGAGWPALDKDAEYCGTTLDAIREELEAMAKEGFSDDWKIRVSDTGEKWTTVANVEELVKSLDAEDTPPASPRATEEITAEEPSGLRPVHPMTVKDFTPLRPFADFNRRVRLALQERESMLQTLRAREARIAELEGLLDGMKDELRRSDHEWYDKLSVSDAEIARLTADAERMKADAEVGALVRRIVEHPASESTATSPLVGVGGPLLRRLFFPLTRDGLKSALSHLDTLFPPTEQTAPEWSAESPYGNQYRLDGENLWAHNGDAEWLCDVVPTGDVPFVAVLLAGGEK